MEASMPTAEIISGNMAPFTATSVISEPAATKVVPSARVTAEIMEPT